ALGETNIYGPCPWHPTQVADPHISRLPDAAWHRTSISVILSATRPSQCSGRLLDGSTARRARTPAMIRSASAPTSVLVPSVTVAGLSVVSRRVTQRTPSAVDSSWSPPLSVRTTAASFQRLRKSMYESG